MSILRIRSIFDIPTSPKFTFLFGPGIEDVFINHRLLELKFEEGLFEELKRQGYDRIIFFSPHQSLFFLDEESANLSRPASQIGSLKYGSNTQMEKGPLSDFNILEQSLNKGPDQSKIRKGMGDNHAIRMIDTLIRQEGQIRTAVIFLQAETTFRYFEDQRTFASLVGDWQKLASTNKSRCFFVFSFLSRNQLVEFANEILVPELRAEIIHQESQNSSTSSLVRISGPDFEEVRRLIYLCKKRFGLIIHEPDMPKLCKMIEAEDIEGRKWIARFEQTQGDLLDLKFARLAGWFRSTVDPQVSVWERLDQLTGLVSVKLRVQEIASWIQVSMDRGDLNSQSHDQPTLHMIFTGNPGTGKTTVARLFGEIFHDLGILRKGHIIEARANDLIADYVGGTALKTNAIIDQAIDGVLFIDEAYVLTESERGSFGKEAVDSLLARLENERHHLVVIAAGYPEKMEQFRLANPGLSRRFPVENIIDFKDYAIGELRKILIDGVNQKSLMMSKESKERLFEIVAEMHKRKDKNFGNAGEIRNLIEGIDRRRALRLSTRTSSNDPEIQLEDIPPSYQNLLPAPASLASKEFLEVIDSLIGLTLVKTRLREMAVRTEYEFARYRANKHNSGRPGLQHLIFIGNPGTGKTTVARMVAEFYKSLGLLSRGQCIEVTRGDLVAGYVGQTAIRTAEKITSALDGVLFIDEAYSLVGSSENDFGNEAIDTLVKMMEDHKDRLVVIAAGYPKEMGAFLNSNPGLKSRFSEPILFEDYSVGELVRIFSFQLEKEHYHTSSEVLERVREYLETIQIRDGLSFHNARSVLQLIEATKTRLAQRVLPLMSDNDDDQTRVLLNHILPEDIPHPGFYMGQFPPKAMQNTKASSTPKF